MARHGGHRKQQQRSGPRFGKMKARLSSKPDDASMEELDDDIDKFHKASDKISLDVDDDNELSSEGDMEEPVFNLKETSSEEEDSMGTDEDDDDELDEEKLSGIAARMAKQAKLLRQRTSLMVGEEDEEDEEKREETSEKKAPWGKRKKMYYSADNVDYELQSSDEEAPAEEEAEALRLQRLKAASLRPEDFEFSDQEDDMADENERSLQEVVEMRESKNNKNSVPKGWSIGVSSEDANILVEEVKKDVSALSKEEQMNVVMSDAPELVGLLAELRETLDELHKKVDPLLEKVKRSNTANREGHLFLQTKHMLLLAYVQAIVFYLLMKAEGRSVRDHPVIARLVDIRTLLEKLQPIDKKLQSQISKLMTLDMESLGTKRTPNNGEVNNKLCNGIVAKKMTKENGGLLRQQRTPLAREDEDTQLCERTLSNGKLASSKTAKTLEHDGVLSGADIQRKPVKNGEAKALVCSDDEDEILPNNKSLHKIISSKAPKKRNHIASGDMDLPVREDLGERRRKHEVQRMPVHLEDMDGSNEQEDSELEQDDFYQQAKRLKEAKLAAKQMKKIRVPTLEPIVEEEVGKRHITYQMEKNKGLTPHRKKSTKNPRKKYKLKHEKAVIRRKGQVREVKLPSGAYGGETTGIRTAISRSVRFNS